MELKVIGTGSSGNCYVMTSKNGESIIIEAGVKFNLIAEALKFDYSNVAGCIISHEHMDHFCAVTDVMKAGITCYMSRGTFNSKRREILPHRCVSISHGQKAIIGEYTVYAFNVNHDAAEPLGFIIGHPESGNTVFITDTYYIENTFPPCNNWIIEANFCEQIMDEKFDSGYIQAFLRDRIYKSHLSLTSCVDILKSNDLRQVNNILLIHLSNSNSHAVRFQETVYNATLKNVTVAKAGLNLKWGKTPFG